MTNSNPSISKHYHQLTSIQRGQIQAMLDSGITSRTVIAHAISRQSVAKSNAEASCKETAAIYCMSTITLILQRRQNCYQRNPLKHYAVFLRMLSRRFKAKFDATSIDELDRKSVV